MSDESSSHSSSSSSGGGGGYGSGAPKKYHSERGHSRQSSNSHPSNTHLSAPSVGAPQPSATPPPSTSCPHISALSLPLIRQRLRSRTFQNAFSQDRVECCECQVHFPKEHLWVCLQCEKIDASRCGRFQMKHSLGHFKDDGHCLAMHLSTRVIWCYSCDNEIPDDYDQQAGAAITPQLIRSALDKEDAQQDAEDAAADNEAGDEDANEDPDAYKALYTNAQGGVTGLSNLGNTCFFNAGIQALIHCPPLIAFFSILPPSRANERDFRAKMDVRTPGQMANAEMRLKLMEDFSVLLQKVWGGRYHLCVPTELMRDIVTLNPFFRGYGQHDSQEFIRCFLDNLHEGSRLKIEYEYDLRQKLKKQAEDEAAAAAEREKEEQEQRQKKKSLAAHNSSDSSMKDDEAAKKPTPAPVKPRYPELSIISDLFQGTLESSVKCSNCGAISLTRDPFYDLSLEIPKDSQLKKIGAERGSEALTPQTNKGFFSSLGNYLGITNPTLSLETCLHSFCTSDNLLQKDQYKCDKCKEKVDAIKILSLGQPENLPEILTLHIKRFSHNYFSSKIGRHVTFPLHNLDVAPFLSPKPSGSHAVLTPHDKQHPQSHHKNQKKQANGHSSAASSSPANGNNHAPALYDLFAIVRHLGSVSGGHYIAYCKSHITDKWYEFDDKIVTEMTEEKISKIEAYVLFYRRKYPVEPLQRILKQVAQATIPNVAAVIPNNASNTSVLPVRYVSKYWLKKMEVLGRPEPIDNRDLCCPHGLPKPLPIDGGDRAVPLTVAGWEALFNEYGGGPIVASPYGQMCEPCQLPMVRKAERARIAEVDALASKQSEDDPFYLIHSGWLQQWRQFVAANGPRPGLITNNMLFDEGNVENQLRAGLKRGDDYRALHGMVWKELHSIYGGGPEIVRPTSDIYDLQPKTKMEDVQPQQEEEEEEEEEGEDEEDAQSEEA